MRLKRFCVVFTLVVVVGAVSADNIGENLEAGSVSIGFGYSEDGVQPAIGYLIATGLSLGVFGMLEIDEFGTDLRLGGSADYLFCLDPESSRGVMFSGGLAVQFDVGRQLDLQPRLAIRYFLSPRFSTHVQLRAVTVYVSDLGLGADVYLNLELGTSFHVPGHSRLVTEEPDSTE
jgi:hypothetical protein